MNTNNLIELRKNLKLTQAQMAKIVNVKSNTYSDYETSKIIIPLEKLNTISNKFDVSLDYLAGITKNKDEDFKHIEIDNNIISKNLQKIRLENNYTQEYIASKLNTADSTISDYELGKSKITILILIEYHELFKVSIDKLCGKK